MRLLVVGLLFVVAELCVIGGGYLDRCCAIGDGKGAEILCWHRTSTKRRYPTTDLDSFLVSLHVLVDDWRRRQRPADRPQPGRPPCFRRARSSRSSSSPSGPLAQRAGLQALRPGAPTLLLPALGEPGSAQPPYPRPGARVAGAPERAVRHAARRPVRGLQGDGYEPRPGDREGEGPPWRAVRWSGELREVPFEDRVGLRLQGGAGDEPRRSSHRLLLGVRSLRREAHWRGPHSSQSRHWCCRW
jgi:hypothetical protein